MVLVVAFDEGDQSDAFIVFQLVHEGPSALLFLFLDFQFVIFPFFGVFEVRFFEDDAGVFLFDADVDESGFGVVVDSLVVDDDFNVVLLKVRGVGEFIEEIVPLC